MTDMWTPPPPRPPSSRRRGIIVGTSLVSAGLVAGAILGASALSSAATISPSAGTLAASTPSAAPSAGSSSAGPETGEHHGGGGLDLSGKVTAVGSSSVTIKTSAGTTTYTVNANSDIDKNGEAVLKNLAVGDAVTFSVDSASSTTIDKLHAGREALDRPAAPPTGTTGA